MSFGVGWKVHNFKRMRDGDDKLYIKKINNY
jgi:hypothetical protein